MSNLINMQDFAKQELASQLATFSLPKYRIDQIYSWLATYTPIMEMTNLPLDVREKLAEKFTSTPVEIVKVFKSKKDPTKKFLFKMQDGEIVEGVLMNYKYGNTLCISSQVGCRMGCKFCASGLDGLIRNLSAGEILSEVLAVNKFEGGTLEDRKVTNIVLMGSGEPLDNYDNVVKFIKLVSSPDGINISQRNISLSTCGLANRIKDLTDEDLNITLTISLHATTDEKRQETMKVAKAYNLSELFDAIRYYFNKTKRRIVFEYIMLPDNTSKEDAKRLKELTKGLSCHINLIPVNSTPSHMKTITKQEQTAFWTELKNVGLSATTRRTLGEDIEGACGQLRRRFLKGE